MSRVFIDIFLVCIELSSLCWQSGSVAYSQENSSVQLAKLQPSREMLLWIMEKPAVPLVLAN